MQKQKQFSVEVVFTGTIEVLDNTTLQNLEENFGVRLGEVQTGALGDRIIDWDICTTPEVAIKEITKNGIGE